MNAGQVLKPVLVIAPEGVRWAELGEEVLARVEVVLEGADALHLLHGPFAEGGAVVVITAGDADVRLELFAVCIQRGQGVG
jgi:hypothetical protein